MAFPAPPEHLPDLVERPLHPDFGVELSGIDVRSASAGAVEWIRAALANHKLVVVASQRLTPQGLAAFARRFGEPETFEYADPAVPEVLPVVSDEFERNPPYWHSDGMMQPEPPSLTFLYAEQTPAQGGETLFLDAEAAYEALREPERKRLHGLRATQPNGVEQPLVRTHPGTGRRALYVDFGVTVGVPGLERDEAVELFERLRAHYDDPARIYRHRPRVGDLLIWDNATTCHCPTRPVDPGDPRTMLRLTLRGGPAA